ncbi:hypothetical protein [Cryptosporangium minutisporangium]|uniref:DNA translocase FtsK 4TM region domain-containing protein n=1 Tax=Cryptosporangium minutisporangium TaxID=113569 RepID=A0ABP6SW28_9ACTN
MDPRQEFDGPRALDDPFGGGDPLTAPLVQPLADRPTSGPAPAAPIQSGGSPPSAPWSAITGTTAEPRSTGDPFGRPPLAGPPFGGPQPPRSAPPLSAPPRSGPPQPGPPQPGPFQAGPPHSAPPHANVSELRGAPSWPPSDVPHVPAPQPPTYDTSAAAAPTYSGSPAFLPSHPIAPTPVENVTEPIPGYNRWAGPTARGTARAGRPGPITATVGDVLMVLGGALVLVFSVLPFVSYTDGRFVAVENRDDIPTSWTAWSPGTFLAPLSWLAILAAVAVAALGVLRILDRGHLTLFGLVAPQIRVLLAGFSFLVLLSFGVSSKTVMFGDDRPQVTEAGVMVDSTLSLDVGGYLMMLATLVLLVGAVLTARSAGGPVVWPLPDSVRTAFSKRTPTTGPTPGNGPLPTAGPPPAAGPMPTSGPTPLATPSAPPYAQPMHDPANGYGPGSAPPGAYYPGPPQMAAPPPGYSAHQPPRG